MILPTEVNFINDTSERIKIKIDKKNDKIINLKPGENFKASGSINGGFDIEVDIIINPKGPGNNVFLGNFKFNNPAVGGPNVRSNDFYRFTGNNAPSGNYVQRYERGTSSGLNAIWGLLPDGYEEIVIESFMKQNFVANQGFASAPIFETQAFTEDDGAKKWDLRIKVVPDPLT